MTSLEYKNKHSESVAKARQLYEKYPDGLNTEAQAEFDNTVADAERYATEASRLDRLEKLEAASKQSAGRKTEPMQFASEPTHKDLKRYSLVRAIRARADGRPLDGLEAEVSAEIAHRYGKDPKGFYLPHDLPMQRYDIGTSQASGAVQTVHQPENFIELLRAKMFVRQLGARVLNDLQGNVALPKQTAGATAYWVTEGNAVTESNQTVGQVVLSPSTVGAFTDITRSLMHQSSIDVENMVREDLATVLAVELDRVAYNGSGSSAEPRGILQEGSLVTVSASGGISFADVVQLESNVASANADIGSLAYVTTPGLRGVMKTTEKASGTAKFIWEDGLVNGYNAYATTNMPSTLSVGSDSDGHALLFGNFQDCVYGFWGGVDVLIDPYTGGAAGTLRVRLLQDADFQVRRLTSFSAILDAQIS